MNLPVTKIFINYECESCGKKEQISLFELTDTGSPLCCDCDSEMDVVDATIKEE